VTMALMASASLACLSVLTSSNPCDVHTHGGAAVATAAPRRLVGLAARLACACCPWSRSCWYGWGGSRALSMASLAASQRSGGRRWPPLSTAAHGVSARLPTGGGRYFIYRPPRVPVSRSIFIQRPRLSKGNKWGVDWAELSRLDVLSSSCRSASPPLLPPPAAGELRKAKRGLHERARSELPPAPRDDEDAS